MAVKPHDPRAVMAPETLDSSVAEILSQPAETLEEELSQLDRAPVSYTHLTLPTICSV